MKIHLITVFLIISLNTVAQTKGELFADSLENEIHKAKEDTSKVSLYLKLSDYYFSINPKKALQFASTGVLLAEALKFENKLPYLYIAVGNSLNLLGKDDSALIIFNKCTEAAHKNGNRYIEANSIRMSGNIHLTKSNYPKATELLFSGLKIAEAEKNKRLLATFHSSISSLYHAQSNYSKAIYYGEKALAYFKNEGNPQALGSIYLNIGVAYAEMKDYNMADSFYKNAVAEFTKSGYQIGLAGIYGNLSIITLNDPIAKIDYLLKAQKIWDEVAPDNPNAILNTGNLGTAYLQLALDSNYDKLSGKGPIPKNKKILLAKAEEHLTYSVNLFRKLDFSRDLTYFISQLALLEETKGNYKASLKYLREYISLNDSLYSQENKNKIAEAEGKHEIEKKNAEIAINKLTIANQKKFRFGLIAGLALLSIIGALLYRQSRMRKKTNTTLIQLNTELDEANKVKAKFFAILSHDLRSPVANLINFLHLQKEEPGLLTAEQAARHQQKITGSAVTLLENMETMLLWSKGQMEHFKPVKKQVPVSDLFTQIEKTFATNTEISFVFINPEKAASFTDEDFLYTIMHNLTANAVKALAQIPGATIEWKAWKEKNDTFLSITDNGPGFPQEFTRNWNENNISISGRKGLGMHIVRDMAKAINCNLLLHNTGYGASVILKF